MAVKVMRRRELTFWEKLYVPQILSGLKITSAHFFRNLSLHMAHSLGLLKNLPASVTFQYPEQPRPLAARFQRPARLTRLRVLWLRRAKPGSPDTNALGQTPLRLGLG